MTIEQYEDVMACLQIDMHRELSIKQGQKIAELEKACAETQELLDKQIEATYRLDKENAELKSGCGMCYRKDKEQLTKAKEIIEKLRALYLSPVVTKDDVKRQDEILNEVEQFLKE